MAYTPVLSSHWRLWRKEDVGNGGWVCLGFLSGFVVILALYKVVQFVCSSYCVGGEATHIHACCQTHLSFAQLWQQTMYPNPFAASRCTSNSCWKHTPVGWHLSCFMQCSSIRICSILRGYSTAAPTFFQETHEWNETCKSSLSIAFNLSLSMDVTAKRLVSVSSAVTAGVLL